MRGVRDEAQPRVDRTSEQQAPLAHGRRLAGRSSCSRGRPPGPCSVRRSRPTSTSRTRPRRRKPKALGAKPPRAGHRDRNWVSRVPVREPSIDPAFVEDVNAVLDDLRALDPASCRTSRPRSPCPSEVAEDPQTAPLVRSPPKTGRAVLFTVIMTGDIGRAAENVDQIGAIREEAQHGGVQCSSWARPTSTDDFKTISEEDLRFGESIGIVAAIIVLIVVFGSLIAGVTPIIMAIFAIVTALGLIVALIGQVWQFSFFAPNLISMMGLAVGSTTRCSSSPGTAKSGEGTRQPRGDRAVRGDGEPRRVLQRPDGRARALGHDAGPDDDLPWPRGRRDHRRAGLGRVVDEPASRPDGVVLGPSGEAGSRLRSRAHPGARARRRLLGPADASCHGTPVDVPAPRGELHDPALGPVLGTVEPA